MSAQFVALVLSYCLGRATISLKGKKKRPWLEIRRPETDLTYLNHQVKMLHRAHDGKLEVVSDVLQTDGFYDDRRVRIFSEDLYRVYDLLFFRDRRQITPEILKITGKQGVAAMWCDTGRRTPARMTMRTWGNVQERRLVRTWLREMGYSPKNDAITRRMRVIEFNGEHADALASDLRRMVPRCRIPSLRPS